MEWEGIDSAPRDGKAVIVASTGGFVGEGWYSSDHDGWWWANCNPTDSFDGEILYATHWMPLPEPPK